MKKTITLLVFLIAVALQLQAQSKQPKQLGLPGDNLNLYAALKVFQESKTLEDFEKAINDPEQKINNLDLDGDDQIDYINVVDKVKDDVHSITLRVDINNREQQDIAVFVVTKESNNHVYIQVVGDEDLYGKDYIIEPNYANEGRPNPGFRSEFDDEYIPAERRVVSYVEVASWPIVQYIYVPTYRPWISIWGFNRYPGWWRPWRPYSWHWYYGYHYNFINIYFGNYSRSSFYRNKNWYNWNYGNNGWRSRSVVYINRYQQGFYRNTYSRPQSLQEGYRVSRDRVPMNMRPVAVSSTRPNNNDRRPNSRPNWNDRDRPYSRPEVNNRPSRPIQETRPTPENRPAGPDRVERPSTRPAGPDRQRPEARPSQPNQTNRPVARPNPPQRTAPEARPSNNGRGNRNGTGTTRNNG
ncbi:MAG TPA: hypothetical protein VJA82_06055 [Sediminibacterium sp.]|uniref:hypothetical protein n=1 Tax=Sediminibacterium sp. TaxID=1917865 RepID=UPI0008B661DC|nr:hypothetical protein [Sediminibacterium sp.]OHC85526.1 MAG: hypothetical protein A2472_07145 [Sphingobacteriia bacterium RIFOXYC2_FULL_35_18]OHC87712.1 MAG: hypothetical protein A2546_03500 [Sphingobacteriia bacterium RIFOXYD2_FULL_35_12]HLD52845.1 hypothetical protein [Sediminibacterium sp.]